jgi:hypothetical protein
MIDGISLAAVGAGSGWGVLAVVLLTIFRMIARGRLITPREADAMQRRIDKQDESLVLKDATIAKFAEGVELNNDLVRAFLHVARNPGPEKGPPS